MALKQALSLVFLTTVFSLMLSGNKGASGAHMDITLPNDIPAALNNFTAGHGNFSSFLVGLLLGIGHQVYTFNGTAWINSNVSADLYDQDACKMGYHYFLPLPGIGGAVATWATSAPVSLVTALPAVRIPQTDAVPLLLLDATATTGPPSVNSGSFGEVTHVQRLQTRDGLAPNTTNATTGDVFFAPYSATYAFYRVP